MRSRKNRRVKRTGYQYRGENDINGRAFAKVGSIQNIHIFFGDKLSSDEMKKKYAKE